MNSIIKNYEILIGCFLYYFVLSKNKILIWNIIKTILGVFIFTCICFCIDKINPFLTYYLVFPLLYFYQDYFLGNNNKSKYLSFISLCISYSVFAISVLISSSILLLFSIGFAERYKQLICFVINLVLMVIPLLSKRMRRGFDFINNKLFSKSFFLICIMIIIMIPFLNGCRYNWVFILPVTIIYILAVFLFLYWRTSITRHYLERLSLRNIDSLNAELTEKTNYIKELEEDKARIEKLNHKNYKLIPAMEGAVMHYLDGVKSFVESNEDNPAFAEFAAAKETDMAGFIDEGNRLLGELNKMLAEWEDIVHNDDIDGKKNLPVCGVTRVDYILSYMYERSLKENFVLKVDVDSELTGLTEKIITDEDLGTLIADLIENAIIATRYNNGKDILVRLGMMKKEYTIEVYDSGIPFDKEVLAKYGYEQITTHADESGSGIGMMQTYEILSKCGASLFIDEFAEGEGMYTKRISVVFNKKHQYVLYTKRSDEEVAYLKKRSDLMIVRK